MIDTELTGRNTDLLTNFREALFLVRQEIRWKAGKGPEHLEKRIRLGHLKPRATLSGYEKVILTVVNRSDADAYVYKFGAAVYAAVGARVAGAYWLVMFGMDGVMETVFPPFDPEDYLTDFRFKRIGVLREVES